MPLSPPERIRRDAMAPRIVRLWAALAPLRSVVSFMQSGAHPDDETSEMLAALRLRDGLGLSIACSTRGEGGQNDIGTEAGADLGTLRTAEMERAAAVLDARLYWLGSGPDDPIHDFGFSKSGEDTLRRWGHGRTLRRFVEVVRAERPDIICPTFLDVPGQHGHHRAMTALAHEVMDAAADPAFAAAGAPWQPKKLYLPAWGGGGGSYDDELPPPPATLVVQASGVDALTGWSWARIGQQSRAFHRTQGMGRWIAPGEERDFPLHLVRSEVAGPDVAVTSGLPATLGELAAFAEAPALSAPLGAAQAAVEEAAGSLPDFGRVVAAASRALAALREARDACPAAAAGEVLHRLARKEAELARVIRLAAGVEVRGRLDRERLRPGETARLTVERRDGAAEAVEVTLVAGAPENAGERRSGAPLPAGPWEGAAGGEAPGAEAPELHSWGVTAALGGRAVVAPAAANRPGQNAPAPASERGEAAAPGGIGRGEHGTPAPLIGAEIPGPPRRDEIAGAGAGAEGGAEAGTGAGEGTRPATGAEAGRESGVESGTLVGAAAGDFAGEASRAGWRVAEGTLAPAGAAADPYPAAFDPMQPAGPALRVRVRAAGVESESFAWLEVPPLARPARSLAVAPEAAVLNTAQPGRQVALTLGAFHPDGAEPGLTLPAGWRATASDPGLTIEAPADVAPRLYELPLTLDGAPASVERWIEHAHVPPRLRTYPARVRVLAAHVPLPERRVGYVGGGNDRVACWLAALGLDVADLSGDFAPERLRDVDTLVVGLFAMKARPALRAAMPAVHRWVEAGGHLLTLYHRPWDAWDPERVPPRRLEIGQPSLRWRVTDAGAAVTHLAPDHPLLNAPNRIGPEDWAGWQKERGLYFAKSWDAAYVPLVEMADPGESPHRGALLSAEIGRGRHTHCALGLHTQMDRLVPGAFRLMANLVG